MAKVLQTGDNSSLTSGLTRYGICANAPVNISTTEAQKQITYRTAGTLSNLWVYIESNSLNGTTTIRTRLDTGAGAGNGAQSVSILTTQTGVFEDTSNTDSITAGDEVNYSLVTAGSSGTIVQRTIGIVFAAGSNTVIRHACGSGSYTFNSTTEFGSLAGNGQFVSSEGEADFDANSDGTLKNLYTYISANSRIATSTMKSRKGNADGALAVSITAAATGVFEDTVNTDTVAANDDINYGLTHGAGGGTLTAQVTSLEYETTNNKFHAVHGIPGGVTVNAATTAYFQFCSDSNTLSAEASAQSELNIAATVSNLYIYISANTVTLASTFDVRQDATSTAVTISITASTTGTFEDAVNSEALVAADLINFRLVTGATGTSLTWRVMGCMFENTEGGVSPSALGKPFHPGKGILNRGRFYQSIKDTNVISTATTKLKDIIMSIGIIPRKR